MAGIGGCVTKLTKVKSFIILNWIKFKVVIVYIFQNIKNQGQNKVPVNWLSGLFRKASAKFIKKGAWPDMSFMDFLF